MGWTWIGGSQGTALIRQLSGNQRCIMIDYDAKRQIWVWRYLVNHKIIERGSTQNLHEIERIALIHEETTDYRID